MVLKMLPDYDTATSRRCPKCKKVLPREDFHKNRSNFDGLNSYCKVCYKSNFRIRKEGKRQNLKSRVLIKEGQRFNHLVAIRADGTNENRHRMWLCECDCGEYRRVEATVLVAEKAVSCGCMADRPREGANFRRVVINYKKTARKKKHEWQLTDEEALALFQGDCFYCGSPPFRQSCKVKTKEPFIFNGIDRSNSQVGYILSNCVSCCTKCNYAKNTMSPQEFEDHIILIYNNLMKRKER
jgi:5-methylcytosine-specific restriction endonuclease McrA